MVYDLTNMTNASSVMGMAQATNGILGGYFFGYFLLLILFFVCFVTLKSKGYFTSACFATSSWLCMVIVLFLRPMSLIDNYTFWAVILLSAISAFTLFMSGNAD